MPLLISFGETMLRLAPPGFERFLQSPQFVATFGGGEANVAVALAKPGDIDWSKVLEGGTWFHITGITPAISQSAAALSFESVRAARDRGLTVSCDLNYRKNLWKYGKTAKEVMSELVRDVDI